MNLIRSMGSDNSALYKCDTSTESITNIFRHVCVELNFSASQQKSELLFIMGVIL
ncbi:hypothetical protein XM68_c10286 [Vibrio alginolyticus]|nr:hypothetical protein XM68_c10286 [Vibrio alginolyticus]